MLYLYASAYNANNPQSPEIPLPEKGNAIISAYILPSVNYPAFKQILYTHAAYCQDSDYKKIKKSAETGTADGNPGPFIRADHQRPVNFTDQLFEDAGGPRVDFQNPKRMKGRMVSVSALRTMIDDLLNASAQKNESIHAEITQYLNRISSEYDRIKDDALNDLPFAEDLPDITAADRIDIESCIDDLKNIEDKADKIFVDREQQMMKTLPELVDPDIIRDLIKTTREQTDYYFDALTYRMQSFSAGIIFVLVILLPYFYVRQNIFSLPNGKWFFLGTGSAAVISLVIGRIFFTSRYKNKIIRIMERFISKYKKIQGRNYRVLEQYWDLLYHDIPEYYSIARYITSLKEFKEQMLERREKITYHDKSRKDRIIKIRSLLDDLDKGGGAELLNKIKGISAAKWREIDPEEDLIANRDIYFLSPDEVRAVLTETGTGNIAEEQGTVINESI